MTDLIAAYEEALARRDGAVATALGLCEARLADAPEDVEAHFLRGAALVLSGRDAILPWTRARLVAEGLGLMDGSVERARAAGAPLAVRLLAIRALSHARLPRLLRSPQRVRALAEELEAHPRRDELPAAVREEIGAHLPEAAAVDRASPAPGSKPDAP